MAGVTDIVECVIVLTVAVALHGKLIGFLILLVRILK